MTRFGEVPFPLALGLVSGVAIGGIVLAILLGAPELVPLPFAVAVALAAWYLYEYSQRPGPKPELEDDFDDPVLEADRVQSGEVSSETGSSTSLGGSAVVEPSEGLPGSQG